MNLKSYEFIHFDSMPGLNEAVAIDLCKKFNKVLKFKNFKFRAGKCEKQDDGFNCGKHVIRMLGLKYDCCLELTLQ